MNESYWMIEKTIEGAAHWWISEHNGSTPWDDPCRWTTDSSKARHYDCKASAEYVMGSDMFGCVATEHLDYEEATKIFMSSRMTLMKGEVVTFALDFSKKDTGLITIYRATGLFEVSASRDAVVVHKARFSTEEEGAVLIRAIKLAEAARQNLADTLYGGAPSKYPKEPTECVLDAKEKP